MQEEAVFKNDDLLLSEGYNQAIQLLHACSTPDGFLASPSESANYRRIWARDGVIISLAALLTEDESLMATCAHTLETLARYQGPHGEIPSNVDPRLKRVSYGGTTGRVDADLWFVIGCGEYWQATGDNAFLERMLPVIERVRFLLGAWEFNNRGLLYIPQTGDWADEYLQNGYILYDQLLYLQAQRSICSMHTHLHGSVDHVLMDRAVRLGHLIRDNYWFDDTHESPEDVYHEVLYKKGREAAPHRAGRYGYWMPFFLPTGYGYRFDGFANVLASLLDVADEERRACVDRFIDEETLRDELPVLPAFHPVIEPLDRDWKTLQMTFSYTFKNRPYEFHNGGLWPMITGFYAADLARRGRRKQAERHLKAIHHANALEMEGKPWGFPEYVHGKNLTPGGTRHQGWSAGAAIMARQSLDGKPVFRINANDQ